MVNFRFNNRRVRAKNNEEVVEKEATKWKAEAYSEPVHWNLEKKAEYDPYDPQNLEVVEAQPGNYWCCTTEI